MRWRHKRISLVCGWSNKMALVIYLENAQIGGIILGVHIIISMKMWSEMKYWLVQPTCILQNVNLAHVICITATIIWMWYCCILRWAIGCDTVALRFSELIGCEHPFSFVFALLSPWERKKIKFFLPPLVTWLNLIEVSFWQTNQCLHWSPNLMFSWFTKRTRVLII